MSFYDINPEAPVHLLVVPKKHITDINQLNDEDKDLLWEMFSVVKKVAKKLKIDKKGYRLILNNGGDSGRLLDHLHLHVLGGRRLGPKLVRE